MSARPREAYRAVYLASPLKFCTSLHAFTPVLPKFYIDPWEKDFRAWHRHKWKVSKQRTRGRYAYGEGPLAGVRIEGWPDPGLIGSSDLAPVASRAQAEGLQSQEFWQSLAERTRQLRDVVSVGDLAVILDALLTADVRHTDLMKTLTRELVDDVDKLSFVELAVVANAYAHFNCVSHPLLVALAGHTSLLLADPAEVESDPRSLAVLLKAFSKLEYRDDAALTAINRAVVAYARHLPFADLADALAAFAALGWDFTAPAEFWDAAAAKVPGSRMASLCPALRAAALLRAPVGFAASPTSSSSSPQPPQKPEGGRDGSVSDAAVDPPVGNPPHGAAAGLRNALVAEILAGLRDTPAGPTPAPLGAVLGQIDAAAPRMPGFAPSALHAQLLAPVNAAPSPLEPPEQVDALGMATGMPIRDAEEVPAPSDVVGGGTASRYVLEDGSDFHAAASQDNAGSMEMDDFEEAQRAPGADRWYNPSSRRPFATSMEEAEFAPFDASELFSRNRRGELVAEALEGLGTMWTQEKDGGSDPVVSAQEADLLEAAAPVLRSCVQGLSSHQLTVCAEAFAVASVGSSRPEFAKAVVQDLVHEAVRKLSNFGTSDLRRLHDAAAALGLDDPYLERARRRRFPKALRRELRDREAMSAP